MEKIEISERGESTTTTSKSHAEKRNSYGNHFEYILLLIGYSVGYGNLWRFPYLVMENGGAAFVIPYFIFLFVIGWSLMLLEQSIGQFNRKSLIKIWDFSPFFRSIGWAFVIVSFVISCYYPIIFVWIIYYTFQSFNFILPWSTCNNVWNTPFCYDRASLMASNGSLSNLIAGNMAAWNYTDSQINEWMTGNTTNLSSIGSLNNYKPASSSQEFWLYNVLEITSSISVPGGLQWKLSIALVVAYLLVYGSCSMGIKSTGKVVYVTAILPYILLTVLVIRGFTLPGYEIGLKFYLQTNFTNLLNIRIWCKAAIQVFYSLGPGWGGVCLFASYSKFHSNFIRDSLIVTLVCGLTSFYAGFAIFSVLGHMAYVAGNSSGLGNATMSLANSDNIPSGPGLVFVVYPEALTYLPGSYIWSVIFFFMMINIGLDSLFANIEVVTATLTAELPIPRKYERLVIFLACTVSFACTLLYTMRNGYYMLIISDAFIASICLFVVCLLELIAVVYFYDMRRVFAHIEFMLAGQLQVRSFARLFKYLKYNIYVFWYAIDPLLILVLTVYSMIHFGMPKMFLDREFPGWCIYLAVFFASVGLWPFVVVPACLLGKHACRARALFRRSQSWRRTEQERYERMRLTVKTGANVIAAGTPENGATNGTLDTNGIHRNKTHGDNERSD